MWQSEVAEIIEVVNLLNVEHERMYSSAFRSDQEATEGSN